MPAICTDEVLDVFDSESTPVHAMVRMGQFSWTWLISQIYRNQRGKPLRLLPFQSVMFDILWNKKFPMIMASRGGGKTFLLGLYALTRAIFCPGSKIIIVGAGLRQSAKVFSYVQDLYNQSPIIQEALHHFGGPRIVTTGPYIKVGELSSIIALPIGDGEKIRGQRATHILCDEFGSIPEAIYETVISPFASVHADPEERVMVENFCSRVGGLGADDALLDKIREIQGYGNQIVISGTATYEFNHFYRNYMSYKMIADSHGDPELIRKAMEYRRRTDMHSNVGEIDPETIKILSKGWKNYAILQMPYQHIPAGFLDNEIIAKDKATFSSVRFGMEYECKFAKDSDGFIKRSSIFDATPQDEAAFDIELYGEDGFDYVMGLDPGRHNDNFGLVVLKLIPGGSKLVYADAWHGKASPQTGRKIRQIMNRFNIVRIAMDKGGGGDYVSDILALRELCEEGELPIFLVREQIENKAMLGEEGYHILELVSWQGWISQAAHSISGDIQHNRLLFPTYPDIERIYAKYATHVLRHRRAMSDEEKIEVDIMVFGKDNEDFEKVQLGVWDNVEATVDETCAIQLMVTPGGVEKFELPPLAEQPDGMDIRRRDRWSALVLAAYAARVYRNQERTNKPLPPGGSPSSILSGKKRYRKVRRKGSVMY